MGRINLYRQGSITNHKAAKAQMGNIAPMSRMVIQAAEVAVSCRSSGSRSYNDTLNRAAAAGKEGASSCRCAH